MVLCRAIPDFAKEAILHTCRLQNELPFFTVKKLATIQDVCGGDEMILPTIKATTPPANNNPYSVRN